MIEKLVLCSGFEHSDVCLSSTSGWQKFFLSRTIAVMLFLVFNKDLVCCRSVLNAMRSFATCMSDARLCLFSLFNKTVYIRFCMFCGIYAFL